MLLKALLQRGVGRLVDHIGQRSRDLVLGVIDVAQGMHEEIIQRFDVA